jgi:hypothetical protein
VRAGIVHHQLVMGKVAALRTACDWSGWDQKSCAINTLETGHRRSLHQGWSVLSKTHERCSKFESLTPSQPPLTPSA